jgi:hypothetical protein
MIPVLLGVAVLIGLLAWWMKSSSSSEESEGTDE